MKKLTLGLFVLSLGIAPSSWSVQSSQTDMSGVPCPDAPTLYQAKYLYNEDGTSSGKAPAGDSAGSAEQLGRNPSSDSQ